MVTVREHKFQNQVTGLELQLCYSFTRFPLCKIGQIIIQISSGFVKIKYSKTWKRLPLLQLEG